MRLGMAGYRATQGEVWLGTVRHGWVRGLVRLGMARRGTAWFEARSGRVWRGLVRLGMARQGKAWSEVG